MSYIIDTHVEKEYLMFVASGKQTHEDNLELIRFILKACEQHQVYKVIVDIRGFHGQPGVISDFKLANFSAAEALGKVKKAAVIHNKETTSFTSFFETAIRNRGINLLAFIDEDEAIEWIQK